MRTDRCLWLSMCGLALGACNPQSQLTAPDNPFAGSFGELILSQALQRLQLDITPLGERQAGQVLRIRVFVSPAPDSGDSDDVRIAYVLKPDDRQPSAGVIIDGGPTNVIRGGLNNIIGTLSLGALEDILATLFSDGVQSFDHHVRESGPLFLFVGAKPGDIVFVQTQVLNESDPSVRAQPVGQTFVVEFEDRFLSKAFTDPGDKDSVRELLDAIQPVVEAEVLNRLEEIYVGAGYPVDFQAAADPRPDMYARILVLGGAVADVPGVSPNLAKLNPFEINCSPPDTLVSPKNLVTDLKEQQRDDVAEQLLGNVVDAVAVVVLLPDCNNNGIADATDIADGTSRDRDGDGVPDECPPPLPTSDAFGDDGVDVGVGVEVEVEIVFGCAGCACPGRGIVDAGNHQLDDVAFVYAGSFGPIAGRPAGFPVNSVNNLVNVLAISAAHEAGHLLGLSHTALDGIMTAGSPSLAAQRQLGLTRNQIATDRVFTRVIQDPAVYFEHIFAPSDGD